MNELVTELREIHEVVQQLVDKITESSISETVAILEKRVEQVDGASSKVWRRNHSTVYYKDFQQPPSSRTYLKRGVVPSLLIPSTNPAWKTYSFTNIMDFIEEGLDREKIQRAKDLSITCETLYFEKTSDAMSCIEIANDHHWSRTLSDLLSDLENLHILSIQEIIGQRRPPPIGGTIMEGAFSVYPDEVIPSHIQTLANILRMADTFAAVKKLGDITEKAISHMKRTIREPVSGLPAGKMIFIGHGRTLDYLQLEKFLEKRLKLEVEEFDRLLPTSTKERLEEMLDNSQFAFLVMTAEDEIVDDRSAGEQGKTRMQARMNVVHEAGLFQGRLGFDKAIIMLENKCEEFSNIHGVHQIRFDKGKIDATFDRVRRHLEEAKIIPQ